MKQIIVMVAMVALGIALATFVMSFKSVASDVVDEVQKELNYTNIISEP